MKQRRGVEVIARRLLFVLAGAIDGLAGAGGAVLLGADPSTVRPLVPVLVLFGLGLRVVGTVATSRLRKGPAVAFSPRLQRGAGGGAGDEGP